MCLRWYLYCLFQHNLYNSKHSGDKYAYKNNGGNNVVSEAAVGEVTLSISAALYAKGGRYNASNYG